jgi:hypothetical protein
MKELTEMLASFVRTLRLGEDISRGKSHISSPSVVFCSWGAAAIHDGCGLPHHVWGGGKASMYVVTGTDVVQLKIFLPQEWCTASINERQG